jgi:hypothetical protein
MDGAEETEAEFFACERGVNAETDVHAVVGKLDEAEAQMPAVSFDISVISGFDYFEHGEFAEDEGGFVVNRVEFHKEKALPVKEGGRVSVCVWRRILRAVSSSG